MKHEKKLTVLVAALLAFVTAWGAVGCFVSAFEIQLAHQIVLVCGCASILSGILFSFRYGGVVLLCLLALTGGYIYRDGRAARQFWQLLNHLTTIYDRAYGWGVFPLSENLPAGNSVGWIMGIWGILIAVTVTRTVCCRKSVWLPVLTTVLPLCACIVVTDTVPGEIWLMAVMAGLILLILTASVRRENNFQGLWLTAAATPPVVLALIGLFLAVPQDSYINHSAILRENILIASQNIPQFLDTGMTQLAVKLQPQPLKSVDLASLGSRIPFTYPVMTVTAEKSGTLYLRGQDYDGYDGLRWSATETRSEDFSCTGAASQNITIVTEDRKEFRYLPYYPAADTALVGGFAENPGNLTEYAITQSLLPEDWRQTACLGSGNSEGMTQYLSLPETTRQEAIGYLEDLRLWSGNASNTEKADLIAALVTDSARYDLNPAKIPETEADFALWFLLNGESGYCVHFATAAAVLLRAADVPSRYVTGYMLEAKAGEVVTVTEENSHAWAEYYEPNLGLWIPLEATPAAEAPHVNRPAPAAPTEAPEPEPTVPETVPDATIPSVNTEAEIPAAMPDVPAVAEVSRKFPTWILALPLLALLLSVQRSLRLKVRRKRQRTGEPNVQALQRWREAVRLSRLLKESPTEELIHLAQKAKFSQHQLTQEELLQFDSFNRTCLRRLREKPRYLQLIYQYIYAAY